MTPIRLAELYAALVEGESVLWRMCELLSVPLATLRYRLDGRPDFKEFRRDRRCGWEKGLTEMLKAEAMAGDMKRAAWIVDRLPGGFVRTHYGDDELDELPGKDSSLSGERAERRAAILAQVDADLALIEQAEKDAGFGDEEEDCGVRLRMRMWLDGVCSRIQR